MSNDIAKWVFVRKNSTPPIYLAERVAYDNGFIIEAYDTKRLSEALIEDVRYFAGQHEGYQLAQVTKKQIFEARLKDI